MSPEEASEKDLLVVHVQSYLDSLKVFINSMNQWSQYHYYQQHAQFDMFQTNTARKNLTLFMTTTRFIK